MIDFVPAIRQSEPPRQDPAAASVAPGILRIEAPLGERVNALYVFVKGISLTGLGGH
ncbi:hypothetical protein BH23CHL8_BH23CHL8_12820 [soil metagenome]